MPTSPLPTGKVLTVFRETAFAVGTDSRAFSLDADTVLLSLFVSSLSSGTLVVKAYTMTEEGKEVLVNTFPTVSGPTGELLLKKAAAVMGRIRIEVVATGVCGFEVRARGITIGEASVRILGATGGTASQTTVGITTQVLIGAGLQDRNGLIIRNNNNTSVSWPPKLLHPSAIPWAQAKA
jgi:hypothetical protein